MPIDWTPDGWRRKVARQQPVYDDVPVVESVTQRLQRLPALVDVAQTRRLRLELAAAAAGKAFVLQGGDCAESFADFTWGRIADTHALLREMALILAGGSGRRVVRVGRIAGQYAKPRSNDTEAVGGIELPVYRGDIINGLAADEAARRADPKRMERAYFKAAGTLDVLRTLAEQERGELLYAAHEALLLPYEEALLRRAGDTGQWYGGSGHFLWIGERTRQLEGAHVELLRGLSNPIGIKLGPSTEPGELVQLTRLLNPENAPGRLTLIARMGAGAVERRLPPLIEAVQAAGRKVLWLCDPMHGNTTKAAGGFKTRHLDTVIAELRGYFRAHARAGTYPGGLHLELTAQAVTECLGGGEQLGEGDLPRAYRSRCDPRLNGRQARELAVQVAALLRQQRLALPAGYGNLGSGGPVPIGRPAKAAVGMAERVSVSVRGVIGMEDHSNGNR